jgi:AcrR family transcriptional regulator
MPATSGRAAPLPPAERRAALIAATSATLRRLGRLASTREIAEAAGVAEGTIFRVFASKEELIDAAVRASFDPDPFLRQLDTIDLSQPLHERLVAFVAVMQARFLGTFELMAAVGMSAPPPQHNGHRDDGERWVREIDERIANLVGPDVDQLACSPDDLHRYLRLLTFSGSHARLVDGAVLPPSTIVDVILYGVATDRRGCPGRQHSPSRPQVPENQMT